MPAAGRVYDWEREAALRQRADVEYAVRLGHAAAIHVARRARAAATQALVNGGTPGRAAVAVLRGLQELLVQAMMYAYLRGTDRAEKTIGRATTSIAAAKSPAYTRGINFLQRRYDMSPAALTALEAKADAHILTVLAKVDESVQQGLQRTMVKIQAENLHVRAGVKELRKEWKNLGLSERNSFQLEAIFRTQTQLAYSAGTAEVLAEPEIDQLLWGFKYVTAGDDRVRDSHVGLDGVTLPKDDPWWATNTPPNGWACRCAIIHIFNERKVVEAPTEVQVDGKVVQAGADPGFGFHPGTILRSDLPLRTPA